MPLHEENNSLIAESTIEMESSTDLNDGNLDQTQDDTQLTSPSDETLSELRPRLSIASPEQECAQIPPSPTPDLLAATPTESLDINAELNLDENQAPLELKELVESAELMPVESKDFELEVDDAAAHLEAAQTVITEADIHNSQTPEVVETCPETMIFAMSPDIAESPELIETVEVENLDDKVSHADVKSDSPEIFEIDLISQSKVESDSEIPISENEFFPTEETILIGTSDVLVDGTVMIIENNKIDTEAGVPELSAPDALEASEDEKIVPAESLALESPENSDTPLVDENYPDSEINFNSEEPHIEPEIIGADDDDGADKMVLKPEISNPVPQAEIIDEENQTITNSEVAAEESNNFEIVETESIPLVTEIELEPVFSQKSDDFAESINLAHDETMALDQEPKEAPEINSILNQNSKEPKIAGNADDQCSSATSELIDSTVTINDAPDEVVVGHSSEELIDSENKHAAHSQNNIDSEKGDDTIFVEAADPENEIAEPEIEIAETENALFVSENIIADTENVLAAPNNSILAESESPLASETGNELIEPEPINELTEAANDSTANDPAAPENELIAPEKELIDTESALEEPVKESDDELKESIEFAHAPQKSFDVTENELAASADILADPVNELVETVELPDEITESNFINETHESKISSEQAIETPTDPEIAMDKPNSEAVESDILNNLELENTDDPVQNLIEPLVDESAASEVTENSPEVENGEPLDTTGVASADPTTPEPKAAPRNLPVASDHTNINPESKSPDLARSLDLLVPLTPEAEIRERPQFSPDTASPVPTPRPRIESQAAVARATPLSPVSAIEELFIASTHLAATPIAYIPDDQATPLSQEEIQAASAHVSRRSHTLSCSSGECGDVSASLTEPLADTAPAPQVDQEQEVGAALELNEVEAATRIQARYRGHRARQSQRREDDTHDAPASADVRHSGEFHDSLVLPPALTTAGLLSERAGRAPTSQRTEATDEQDDSSALVSHQDMPNNLSSGKMSFLDRAATRIQATFRGFKTRNDLKSKPTASKEEHAAASKIQAGFKGFKVRKEMKEKSQCPLLTVSPPPPSSEEEKSAVKIQAGVRGYLTRQRLKKERSPTPTAEPSPDEINNAVVKIQAGFRGYKARQEVKNIRQNK